MTIVSIPLLLVCLGAGGGPAAQPTDMDANWFPFVAPWDRAPAGAFNASFLNRPPAGSNGRIIAKDGHFVESKTGKRIRFFGTNVGTSTAFPTHADADKIADRLAGLGINLVRFHHLNNGWDPDGGYIWKRGRVFLEFDPVQVDRLDYFVAALKKRGIYSNINLQTAREYLPEMGFPESVRQLKDFAKKVDRYDERMIELQKQYARDLIGRKNPYTGLTYAEDPAIFCLEINNENSLVGWTGEEPGTGLSGLPEPFRGNLVKLWNDWLRKKYGTEEAIRKAWPERDTIEGPSVVNRNTKWTHENQSNGDVQFETYAPEGGEGSMGMRATVRSNPGPNWHVQIHLSDIDLKNGQSYIVEFRGRADKPVSVGMDARLSVFDWRFIGLSTQVDLTPEWRTYKVVFRCRDTLPNSARIGWVIGDVRGTVAIENVRVMPGTRSEGIPAGQSLGSIDLPPPDQSPRYRDYVQFLADTDRAYSERMLRFLREELGFKQTLIVDTQIAWGGLTGPYREQSMDFVDMHEYWNNPLFLGRSWDPKNYRVNRQAMVNEMGKTDGALGSAAKYRLAGKPYSLSEYNHPAPNDFQVEMMPLLSLYAARQDWDAVYTFSWDTTGTGWVNDAYDNYFNMARIPAKNAFFPIAAAIIRQGLIEPAGPVRAITLPDIPWSKNYHWPDEWKDQAPVVDGLRERLYVQWRGHRAPPAKPDGSTAIRIRQESRGQVVAAGNDRVAILVGFFGGTTQKAGPLTATFKNFGVRNEGFAGLMMAAMDGKPVATSERIALAIAARTENVGMGWNEARDSVGDQWGRGPLMAEGVPAKLEIACAKPRRVFALDAGGKRVRQVDANWKAGRLTFEVGPKWKTLWYEIVP